MTLACFEPGSSQVQPASDESRIRLDRTLERRSRFLQAADGEQANSDVAKQACVAWQQAHRPHEPLRRFVREPGTHVERSQVHPRVDALGVLLQTLLVSGARFL
jgi:hypothetical protein